jgi:hypothetical protein
MGICDCGEDTVWNDMYEGCLHEYELGLGDILDKFKCNVVGSRPKARSRPKEKSITIQAKDKPVVIQVETDDKEFLVQLIYWLNAFPVAEGRETIVRIL